MPNSTGMIFLFQAIYVAWAAHETLKILVLIILPIKSPDVPIKEAFAFNTLFLNICKYCSFLSCIQYAA